MTRKTSGKKSLIISAQLTESRLHPIGAEILGYLRSKEGGKHPIFSTKKETQTFGKVEGFHDAGIPVLCFLATHRQYDFNSLFKDISQIPYRRDISPVSKIGLTSQVTRKIELDGKEFFARIVKQEKGHYEDTEPVLGVEFFTKNKGKAPATSTAGMIAVREDADNERVLTLFNIMHDKKVSMAHKEALVNYLFQRKFFKPTAFSGKKKLGDEND